METGTEGVGSVQEETEVLSDVEPQEIESDVPEENIHETATETAARALAEIKAEQAKEGTGDKGQSETPAPQANRVRDPITGKFAKSQPADTTQAQASPGQIQAPNRLNAHQKEVFNKLPDDLKKAAHRMFYDYEVQFTRGQQEAQRLFQEAKPIADALAPHRQGLMQAWKASGMQTEYSDAGAIQGILSAQAELTNPQTSLNAWLKMGHNLGHITEEQAMAAGAGQSPQYDISAHPQFRALQETQQALLSRLEAADREQFEHATNSIVSEMEAVQLEKDSFGNYLYPELLDEQFLASTEPLVSALKGTLPGLSYGEALKRAWSQLTGKPIAGNSPSQSQTRLPQNQIQNRAVQAAVSVRGKTGIPSGKGAEDVPAEALTNGAASARYAMALIRRGAA